MKHLQFLIPCLAMMAIGCCGKIEDDAKALKSKHQKCEKGDTCVIVQVDADTCLGPFGCWASINEKTADKYKTEARELEKDYEDCNTCTMADCMSPDGLQAYCDVANGKCDTKESEQ